jgi:hypothetical protein
MMEAKFNPWYRVAGRPLTGNRQVGRIPTEGRMSVRNRNAAELGTFRGCRRNFSDQDQRWRPVSIARS